jgi:hypothetical protein
MTLDDLSATPPLDEDWVLRRHNPPRLEHVEVAGETVVYDCEAGSLHLLDPVATVIWTLLDGTASLRETSEQIAGIFGRPVDEVLQHVCTLAAQLADVGLVHRVG